MPGQSARRRIRRTPPFATTDGKKRASALLQKHKREENFTDEAGLSWAAATRMQMTALRLVHSRIVR